MSEWNETADFDQYAGHYDDSINQALRLTGEKRDYFARKRIEWLARCVAPKTLRRPVVMDFGCGTGSAAALLLDTLDASSYVGVDTSAAYLDVARKNQPGRFYEICNYSPCQEIDVVYCNGVFHHIPVDQRGGAADYLWKSLKPGGLLALWENNPLNLIGRYMMSRIPFDRGAITLSAAEAKRLVECRGFLIIRTDHLFIFPRWLSPLRRFERHVSGLPLGAQYQVLCEKPR
jgi:SAM-dependent methyltransferase